MIRNTKVDGFTIIEIIVTTAVTALFLGLLFQAYMTMEYQRIDVARQAKASDIAFSNLRKITVRPLGLVCDESSMSLTVAGAESKQGALIGDGDNLALSLSYGFNPEPTDIMKMLGSDAKQTIRVFAPQGCTNFDTSPIKIISTVTYGNRGEKAVHASYIK